MVFHTQSREEAAFLTIYLNSQINRMQISGTYSITKQKFLNQSKIASLRVFSYSNKYNYLMGEYLDALDLYYNCIERIKHLIHQFDADFQLPFSDTTQYGFTVKPASLEKKMLVPNYYRNDIQKTIDSVVRNSNYSLLDRTRISKGDEIGSANYTFEGVPFIKTSDIINYDVDYEPDCYCSELFLPNLNQNIKKRRYSICKRRKTRRGGYN